MLVFNEGVPRSGKSYDAVKNHVLPAIKSGRVVYARINGLDHDKIAAYLGMNADLVRDLLRLVSTAKVKETFLAVRDETGEWCIADNLKNALFVIDECHEFYVASREAINPSVEQFFALCGQNGMDGVLMSQWYRRLHSSVRARIERKNVFQKLTAVGMTGKYVVSRFHTTTPDRFEKVGTDTCSYDPDIFPLYKGYADGASNTEVYKAGGKTVWSKIGKYAIFVVPAVLLAIFVFHRFFHGDGGLAKAKPSASLSRVQPPVAPINQVEKALQGTSLHPTVDTKGMPPGVAYVFTLISQARPRLVGWIDGSDGSQAGIIEWRQDSGTVLDRMTVAQLRDLGMRVDHHLYGVELSWQKQVVVVTSWPVDTSSDAQGALPSAQGGGVVQASPSHAAPASASSAGAPGQSGEPSVLTRDAGWKQNALAHDYVPPELMEPIADDPHARAASVSQAR